MIAFEPVHKPCLHCGNTTYLAPYARTSNAVICSRQCWEKYTEQKDEKEETKVLS